MKRRAHPHESPGELNIIPYLDIVVNLVMFLLMSMTGFVTFTDLNVNVPGISRSDAPAPEKDSPRLDVSVLISPRGFFVGDRNGHVPANPTVPVREGRAFDYDYDRLHSVIAGLQNESVKVTRCTLTADPTVRYDTVVRTMDAVRGTAEQPLLSDVVLAAIQKS